MKVLVIDDNAVNRRYVKSVIESERIEVFQASNGKMGIESARQIKPNLVLVDIQMPDMDGFECLAELVKIPLFHAPILAITAFSNPEDREVFLAKGFQDYITKPVKPNVLASTIKYWLNKQEKRKEELPTSSVIEFDYEAKEELMRHIGPEGLQELFVQFEEEMGQFFNQLMFLNSSKNYYNICSILHTIKGNAGSLGFFKLSELANQLEIKIEQGEYDHLESELEELIAYAKQLFNKYETQFNLNL